MKQKNVLLGIDRDGTLIKNDDFFGKNNFWKKEIELNHNVINFLFSVCTKFKTTKIVLSNQSGVARGFFTIKRVMEINTHIDYHLRLNGIKIDNWQFCPDVDNTFVKKHPEIKFTPRFVKPKTKRKPSPDMLFDGLATLKLSLTQFDHVVIFGDRNEDKELAQNIKGKYLDVNNKKYQDLLNEFIQLIS